MLITAFDILESNFCTSIAVNLGILTALVPFSAYILFEVQHCKQVLLFMNISFNLCDTRFLFVRVDNTEKKGRSHYF